jgi:hypothetical protein
MNNPYIHRSAITDPESLYGRKKQMADVIDMLKGAQCCSIVGERRIGKSSFLRYMSNPQVREANGLPRDKYIFAFVDFQGKLELSPEDFRKLLLRRLSIEIHDEDVKSHLREISQQEKVAFFDMEDLMYEIDNKGINLICLFDEFEYTSRSEKLDFNFFSGLRSLANSFDIAYVTATRISLIDLQYSNEVLDSPFFNIFREIPLGLFTHEEAMEMIHIPTEGKDISFDRRDEQFILTLGGYHPFFLQLACYHLFHSYSLGIMTKGELYSQSREGFVQEADSHFRYYWEKSDDGEKDVLCRLALMNQGKQIKGNLETRKVVNLVKRGLVTSIKEGYSMFSQSFVNWIIDKEGLMTSEIEAVELDRATMERLQQELEDARQMQISLLPESAPPVEGFDIVGFSKPAREVGGDFFDYLSLADGKIGIALADVSGKGLKGAMNAVLANGMLREAAKTRTSCGEILSVLNAALYPRMEKHMFTALGLAALDQDSKTLQWANAAQHYPIVKRGERVFQFGDGGLPLSVVPNVAYPDWELELQTGDIVIF